MASMLAGTVLSSRLTFAHALCCCRPGTRRYIVDAETSTVTGLPANTVVVITTCNQGGRGSPPPADPALAAYMCVGLAQSWRHPVIVNTTIMWRLPDQNDYANISVLTQPFHGWGSE